MIIYAPTTTESSTLYDFPTASLS